MKNLFALLCAVFCAAASASSAELVGTRFETGAASPKALLEQFRAAASNMRSVPHSFSFADALPPAPPDQPQQPPAADTGYIDNFRAIEANLLAWDQAYQQAPGGSEEEAEAKRQRQLTFDSAQPLIDDASALEAYSVESIEDLAKDCSQKYQAAQGGSLVESFYKEFIPVGWKAFAGRSKSDLTALGHWRWITDAAERYEQRYQAAPGGSPEEAAAKELREFAWELAPQVLERQLAAVTGSFRGIEAMASEFEAGYQAAAGGSAREGFYNRARSVAYDAAVREAGATISGDPRPEVLAPLEQEYNAKYQSASGGSPSEAYFKKVRDLARQYLGQQ
ncbi:MAG: hypothetical protein HY077_08165 [Elusimicrobia bacterium]|nr:hypothetical protein [Elusimicrobiota bacterium]